MDSACHTKVNWHGGVAKFFVFLKILTDFNEAKEYGKSEIFRSQPLTSMHGAVLCGINDTLTHNFVVYCAISTKKIWIMYLVNAHI